MLRPLLLATLCLMLWCVAAGAVPPTKQTHYQLRSWDAAPGAVGGLQLSRGGPLPGYFQPVRLQAPAGATISLVVDGTFQPDQPAPVTAGMLIGQVYRFKVANIPLHEGSELFPTVEVINRLYPPRGLEARFPIPVELAQDEIERALEGQYVTRVIYLEDPTTAIANRQGPGIPQPVMEAFPDEDALEAADRLGRPVAILRMGSRVPDASTNMQRFTYGSPAFIDLPAETAVLEPASPPAVAPIPAQQPSAEPMPAAAPSP